MTYWPFATSITMDKQIKKIAYLVIPKVPWTSLDIWSSKGRTFTGPKHFLLDQKKKFTQFKCNILFSCIFIYVSPVFNFIMPIFTKVIIFAIFCMSCVVALIVIQPFVIGQPLYVKFMCLSIFLMLLRFLPLVVTFRVFPFQILPGIAPGTYPSPNILITTKDRWQIIAWNLAMCDSLFKA